MRGRVRVFPLGYPVDFESESKEVLAMACTRWSQWPRRFDQPPIRLVIEVGPGKAATVPPSFRVSGGELLFFCDLANRASFSTGIKSGLLRVSHDTIAERHWFEYHLLAPLVLTALDTAFFDPVHAACVAFNDRGILLCG